MSIYSVLMLMLLSFLITTLILPSLIKYLHKLKFGQEIRKEGPSSHSHKKGTPTMGGISFIFSIVLCLIFAVIIDFKNSHNYFLYIYITLAFATIGYIDDMLIVVKKKNDGLSPKKKLLLQIIFSTIFYFLITYLYADVNYIYLPIIDYKLNISFLYLFFVIFWQTGFSNAVNLTDGLDGLATSVTIFTTLTLSLIAYNEKNIQIFVFCLIIVGALLGFLIFNRNPAKIFMGDTGSLALGGILAGISIILHKEVAFLIIGFLYVLETFSVILQVIYFKKTGKRIFKMAPIHHHFELSGYGEKKSVYICILITIISCSIGYFVGVL